MARVTWDSTVQYTLVGERQAPAVKTRHPEERLDDSTTAACTARKMIHYK